MFGKRNCGLAAACLLGSLPFNPVFAVQLSSEAVGQALIYPYYTTQSLGSDPYNTYITVVNQAANAKAVRVRFREAGAGHEVASFNLFLSPGDTWAGALSTVASSGAARLVSVDRSCVSPAYTGEPAGVTFSNAQYSAAFDSWGTGLERTREGWVEVLEMGTLSGDVAAAVTHGTNGSPPNCAAIQGTPTIVAGAPSGGLSGTLTLINVANGLNFTVNADALADVASRSFYRPASDPYPDFNASEVDPLSIVIANGQLYRSTWNRGADAITAVLMRSSWTGELILDTPTSSNTDFVTTFPTRPYYYSYGGASPFGDAGPFAAQCPVNDLISSVEFATIQYADREEGASGAGLLRIPCRGSNVISFAHAPGTPRASPSRVLASRYEGVDGILTSSYNVPESLQSGWATITKNDRSPPFTSLATSTRINLGTGAVVAGAHIYYGLPVIGFSARTFSNGTLPCGGGTCQGNYGGAYPLRFTRKILNP